MLFQRLLSILLLLVFFSSCKAKRSHKAHFIEKEPRVSSKALWSSCSEIPFKEEATQKVYTIGEKDYYEGGFLAEGGTGKVYALDPYNPSNPSLVLKILKEGSLDAAYMDLIFHSTMEIIGVPTVKVAFGYITRDSVKEFVLIKERVSGVNFADIVFEASLFSFPWFSTRKKQESNKQLSMAGQVFSRVINSGIYISDMHSRNTMWDGSKEEVIMVDGNIEPLAKADSIDKKKSFGRAISLKGGIGDRIFYDRYYDSKIEASAEARAIARARIDLFFIDKQKFCAAPDASTIENSEGAKPYEIDAHKVFGG